MEIQSEIRRLEPLRDAWQTIVDAEQKMMRSATGIFPAEAKPEVRVREEQRPSHMTMLRHFVVTHNGSGVSRSALVEKARALGAPSNLAYKFITRMKEAGELTESDGRYLATAKMASRFPEIAAGHPPQVAT